MKALKILVQIIIFCFILISTFGIYDHYSNKQAYDVQEKIIATLDTGFNEQSSIKLTNIGGINWEKVCFISYELNGYDAAHGLDIPIKYLKIPSKSFSQIADETYTEFKGSEYGMVFWSLEHKIFVAIPLDDSAKVTAYECHDGKNLVLFNKVTPEGRVLNLSQ